MSLPQGASLAAGELARIEAGIAALGKKFGDKDFDPHAPRQLSVKVNLHFHHEFPKHVTVGKDDEGNPITKIANNPAEEKAALAAAKPKKAAKPAEPAEE